jgi:protein O-mannosyl-transferase
MSDRWRFALLLAAVLLVYGNSLRNQFTQDDGLYIETNPQVLHPTLQNLLEQNQAANVFRPLTFATFALNHAIGGLTPWGYHLVNLLLHAGISWLLYLLLCASLGESQRTRLAALAAAWLFALHPIHTEAVTAAVGRAELLAAGLLLAAWLLHLRDREIPALCCLALALLAKESPVVFLPLVVLGDFVRTRWKPVVRYARIAGVMGLYLVTLWYAQGGRLGRPLTAQQDNPLDGLPAQWRILNALRVVWKYVGLQLYPATLSCDYSYNAIPVFLSVRDNLLAASGVGLVLAAWLWALWSFAKRWKDQARHSWFQAAWFQAACFQAAWFQAAAILGCGIYLISFSIVSNVLIPTGTIMGERLVYLPSAGFCLLIALAWTWLYERRRTVAIGLLAVICALLASRTVVRNRDWYDNFTLFTAAVRAVPESTKAHNNLAGQYMARKETVPARAEYEAALRIYPDNPDALAGFGLLAYWQKDYPTAERAMDRALNMSRRDNPNYDFMTVNYAALLMQTGRQDRALQILDQEIAGSPGYARAWANRAVIHYQRGEKEAARSDAESALRLDPENTQARGVLQMLAK